MSENLFTSKDNFILSADDCYTNANWHNFTMPSHGRGFLECNYVLKGKLIYQIGDKEYLLKKRSFIIFDSRLSHHMKFIKETMGVVQGFSLVKQPLENLETKSLFSPFNELAHTHHDLREFFDTFDGVYVIDDAHFLYPTIQEIASECLGVYDLFYFNTLMNKLLVDISRFARHGNGKAANYVMQVKQYIQNHYYEIACIDDIADFICLNKTYLQRMFKEQTGITIWQYLTDTRMNAAANLLRTNGNIHIGDIDQYVGINSRQNFYLTFRKKYGMSPMDYRKSHLNPSDK